ncbi:AAA family ATPase [Phosphitispora fastidiosa]|uniref:AAA family ATPase n=1 Tax=Phosphitispora fastidiosa TaxID=2837202 RepID=UPI001E4BF336|nr:MoxR family ATPase [Phosphitispora fastidiosa]MBU7006829.1 MoxR-like ATPase [Phosphitispora fastidiosa]
MQDMYDIKDRIVQVRQELAKVVAGQEEVIEELIVGLLMNTGHILLEGVPGTGKTLLVKTLAQAVDCEFKRVQFTPDLMPSDIIGTNVYNFSSGSFTLKKGPVFTSFLLADEINRTPPKTQAALLEVMEEKQVTIDGIGYRLEEPFFVIATQNPIEHEGTYPLPEAQLDRFLMKIIVDYPSREEEKSVLRNYHSGFRADRINEAGVNKVLTPADILIIREKVQAVVVEDAIFDYILAVVEGTRKNYNLMVGASPRASINLLLAGKVLAAITGRGYVVPDDIKRLAAPVLRHRLALKPEAEIEGLTADDVIRLILDSVEVPR